MRSCSLFCRRVSSAPADLLPSGVTVKTVFLARTTALPTGMPPVFLV